MSERHGYKEQFFDEMKEHMMHDVVAVRLKDSKTPEWIYSQEYLRRKFDELHRDLHYCCECERQDITMNVKRYTFGFVSGKEIAFEVVIQ